MPDDLYIPPKSREIPGVTKKLIEHATERVLACNAYPGPKLTHYMARVRARAVLHAATDAAVLGDDRLVPLSEVFKVLTGHVGDHTYDAREMVREHFEAPTPADPSAPAGDPEPAHRKPCEDAAKSIAKYLDPKVGFDDWPKGDTRT